MGIGVGLELAPSQLRGVILSRSGRRLTLESALEIPCDTSDTEQLSRALTQIRKQLPIKQNVVLGISSNASILATVNPLIPTPARANYAVEFELQQYLPYDVSEALWHYHWLSNVSSSPSKKPSKIPTQLSSHSVVVAAIRENQIENQLQTLQRLGVSMRGVCIGSIAALNAWLYAQRNQPADTTEASSRLLLHIIDETTAEWINWSPQKIEVVPIAGATQVNIDSQVESNNLWTNISSSWNSLQVEHAQTPSTIWILGPSSATGDIARVINGPSVKFESFSAARIVNTGSAKLDDSQAWAASLGLALQAIDLAPIPLNLIQWRQRQQRVQTMGKYAWAVGGVSAAVAIGFGVQGMQVIHQQRASNLDHLEKQERTFRRLRPEIRDSLKSQLALERRMQQLQRIATGRAMMDEWLLEITKALPKSAWLTKLETSRDGQLISVQRTDRNRTKANPNISLLLPSDEDVLVALLEGRAKEFRDVTYFLDRLKELKGMDTVKPLSSDVVINPENGKEEIRFIVQIRRSLSAAEN